MCITWWRTCKSTSDDQCLWKKGRVLSDKDMISCLVYDTRDMVIRYNSSAISVSLFTWWMAGS